MGAGEANGGRRGWWGQARPMGAASHMPHAPARQHRTLGKAAGQIPTQQTTSSPTSVLPMSPNSLLLAKSVSPLPTTLDPHLPSKPVSLLPAKLDPVLPACSQQSIFHPDQRSRIHRYHLAPSEVRFSETYEGSCQSSETKHVRLARVMPDPEHPASI